MNGTNTETGISHWYWRGPRLVSVLNIEQDWYWDWYQSLILNVTNSKTSISHGYWMGSIPGLVSVVYIEWNQYWDLYIDWRWESQITSYSKTFPKSSSTFTPTKNYCLNHHIQKISKHPSSPEPRGTLDFEWDQYLDQLQLWILNGTNTEIGISYGYWMGQIPIPVLVMDIKWDQYQYLVLEPQKSVSLQIWYRESFQDEFHRSFSVEENFYIKKSPFLNRTRMGVQHPWPLKNLAFFPLDSPKAFFNFDFFSHPPQIW